MAKITPGAIISEISGSIANVTYSRSKYGMYSKAKLNQTNPNTPAQIAARAIQAAAVAAWQALPQDEQSAWNTFAVSQLSKSRLSLRSTLNGYNAFIRFYIVRNSYGLTGNPDRVLEQPLGIYSGFSFTVNTSTLTLALDGNNVNTEIFAVARLSGPRSPGQSTITDSYVVIMDYQVAPNGTLVFDLKAAWQAKWGSLLSNAGAKIFAQIDIVNRITAQKVVIFRGSAQLAQGITSILGAADSSTNSLFTSIYDLAWVAAAIPFSKDFWAIAFAPSLGKWCAIANGTGTGEVFLSSDGITWMQQTTIPLNTVQVLAWCESLGLFILADSSSSTTSVMTSPDGINWTSRTTPNGRTWAAIAVNETAPLVVITSYDYTGQDVLSSPDGITWTLRNTPGPLGWAGVIWAPSLSLWIAVNFDGTTNGVMTSPDGINWTLQTTPGGMTLTYIAWSELLGLAVAIAGDMSGNDFLTSPDGINWTQRASPVGRSLSDITWDPTNKLFIVSCIDTIDPAVFTSPDGINWTSRTTTGGRSFAVVRSKP